MKQRIALLIAVASLVGASAASAAGPRRAAADASIYQQEVAVCGHNQQDRAACVREAGAARQAAARGGLTTPPDYLRNALGRCARQSDASDRAACEARVQGAGRTSVDGSVMGGGLIYETVTPLPLR